MQRGGGHGSPAGGALDRLADDLEPLGPPVIVFNVAHSGSGLLASALVESGVFMGAERNASFDATAIEPLVRHVIEENVPEIDRPFHQDDPALAGMVREAMARHLAGRAEGMRWGWKLGETAFILPLLARLFPMARFVHLVRDGRDVAFSPFVAPKDSYWRKVYFGTDRIESFHGLPMTQRAYRARGPVFNAARWVTGVRLGRKHGASFGPRYREVRYEDLVGDFPGVMSGLLRWLEVPGPAPSAERMNVHTRSVGKWRQQPAREIANVTAVLEPTLAAFGYSEGGPVPPVRRDALWRRLLWS